MTNRREFLSGLLPGLALAQARPVRRPNIVLILADDLGYGDLGCYGQETIPTPHLDRMASEGMRFTQAYSGSTVCGPSRCSLMTGLHQGHARVRGNRASIDAALRPSDLTVSELLQSAGYDTALFGKWHLGGAHTNGFPLKKGFDEYYGFLSGKHAQIYYPHHVWDGYKEYFIDKNRAGTEEAYSQDLVMERAIGYLEQPRESPFFMMLASQIPHADSEAGRRVGDGMTVPEYGQFSGRDWPNPEKGFAAMIARLDRDVGRVLDTLRRQGLERDTLVIFTSDNGPHREGGHSPDFFNSNGPLRGIKRDLYEGGIRVPMIARLPGAVEAGAVSGHACAFWDFLPTAAELAGVEPPPGTDGLSFAPELSGRPQPEHDHLYWEFHSRQYSQAVRQGDWKAVRSPGGAPLELYDLADDLGETRDVAAGHPAVARRMDELMSASHVASPDWPVEGE